VSEEDDDGLGLGLLDDGLGLGLPDDGVGVGLLDDGVGLGLADDGVGVGLADEGAGAGLAGVEDAALGLAAGLVVLAEAAVSWAAQGFAAAGAALAVPVSNAPARLAGMMINPEITPNARAMARRLFMDPPSPPWSSRPGRARCHHEPVTAGTIPRHPHSTPGRVAKGTARPKGI
jgi:hypothetical protein